MPAGTRLPWPDDAPVLPVEELRPVLESFASLATRHPHDVTLLPTAVDDDGEVDASIDPPPALAQVLEEFGGIELCGRVRLDLLVDERGDLGPYTLLGEPTTYYPLHEGADVALVLAIDEDGAPGAVYGIGEDLSMTLAARDLGHLLERWLHAMRAALAELDAEERRLREDGSATGGPASSDPRADAAERLMDAHLLATVLGRLPEAERERVPVLTVEESGFESDDLPEGAIAVADLRDAPLDATAELMEADLPGDPLELSIAWGHAGQVLAVIGDDDEEDAL